MSTAADLLLDTARRGELHHAIILHGPAKEPLRELAIRIAKAMNCLNRTTGDDCASCVRIDKRLHPDVHFTEVAEERKQISIEQIRDLVNGAALRPYEGRAKVFIIDPADAFSTGASNALLKTLEEPARDTTFVLLTSSPDLLLPTIRSRSQSLYVAAPADTKIGASAEARRLGQLRGLSPASTREALANETTELLARFAAGDAMALLSIASLIGSEEQTLDAMGLLAVVLSSPDARLDPLPMTRRMAAADALLIGMDAVRKINADARLVIEGALARLAV